MTKINVDVKKSQEFVLPEIVSLNVDKLECMLITDEFDCPDYACDRCVFRYENYELIKKSFE
jgi:hypothetical protein